MKRTEPSPSKTLLPVPVLGVHLVGVAEWVIGRVDDHLGMVVDVGAAVDSDQVASAVGVGRPGSLLRRQTLANGTTPTQVASASFEGPLADERRCSTGRL